MSHAINEPGDPRAQVARSGSGPADGAEGTKGTEGTGSGRFPLGLTVLLTLAALVIVLAGVRTISGILGPAFFALTLAITAKPLHRWLDRALPRWLATLLTVLMLYVVLAVLFSAVAWALASMVTALPDYANKFNALWAGVLEMLRPFGWDEARLETALKGIDFNQAASAAQGALSSLSAGSSQLVMLLIMLGFLSVDLSSIAGRARLLEQVRPDLAAALEDFAARVRRYWVVTTVFGLIVAIMDGVALAVLGVPMVFTWVVLSFVTNYIPNIGFVLGLIPPALMALLSKDIWAMLWVVAAYCVINFVMQSIIQPKFTGDAVGLNTSVTFLSLAFWASIIGAMGAILAVPLTLFVKSIVIDASREWRWASVFLQANDRDPGNLKAATRGAEQPSESDA